MLAQKPTESTEAFHARTLADFDTFLESHGDDIGVLLVVSGLKMTEDQVLLVKPRGSLDCTLENLSG